MTRPQCQEAISRPDSAQELRASHVGGSAYALNDTAIRKVLDADRTLSLLEAELLFRICCLSVQRGYCWASQTYLAELVRHSERSTRAAIAALRERGLLVTVRSFEGLTYLPQWEAIGFGSPPVDRVAPAPAPAPHNLSERQDLPLAKRPDLPLHYRSHSSGSHKRDSSRDAPPSRPAAAALSKEPDLSRRAGEGFAAEVATLAGRYGPEAELDVLDVLSTTRARSEAVQVAFARLLAMDVAQVKSAGATFRTFVRLANEGRLATPAKCAPITQLGKLLAELDQARERGDCREVARLERERFELGQQLKKASAS